MSNAIAIKVDSLDKTYKLYDSPGDRLKEALNPLRKKYYKEFFALQGVSFEIPKGETVGIIGCNGAGKSTLLKIITGVIAPTGGSVEVEGRISALLELGAGFNPDLSGLENVYFNGTLLGFSKEEMDVKVKDIVAFADIGDFIHQPVKTYSSGMGARLAFATAINVDPDILIVDEALSVGDFAFQFKCMNKFRQFQEAGKTILFVSHSTQNILQYCSSAIYLNHGKLVRKSRNVKDLIYQYEKDQRVTTNETVSPASTAQVPTDFTIELNSETNEHRFGTHEAIMRSVVATNVKDSWEDAPLFMAGDDIFIKMVVLASRAFPEVVMGVTLKNKDGIEVWGDNTPYALGETFSLKEGANCITFSFKLMLTAGEFMLYCGLADVTATPRIELDQRWSNKKITVRSLRPQLGWVYSPAQVTIEN
jgi:lipopolysaccharide transport system ATP-binding protein